MYLTENQIRLEEKYPSLTPFAQRVLHICAIIDESATSSLLLRCLYESRIHLGIAAEQYPQALNESLLELRANGFIDGRNRCVPEYIELGNRHCLEQDHYEQLSAAVRRLLPLPEKKWQGDASLNKRNVRELRIDLYTNNIESFHKHLVNILDPGNMPLETHPIVSICNNPFDPAWFQRLPIHIQFLALHEIMKEGLQTFASLSPQLDFLLGERPESPTSLLDCHPSFIYLAVSILIFQGRMTDAETYLKRYNEQLTSFGLTGFFEFIHGNRSQALEEFNRDLQQLRSINKDSAAFFTGFEGLIYILLLMQEDPKQNSAAIKDILQGLPILQPHNKLLPIYDLLASFYSLHYHLDSESPLPEARTGTSGKAPLCQLFNLLRKCWLNVSPHPEEINQLQEAFGRAEAGGFHWIAYEIASVLKQFLADETVLDYRKTYQRRLKLIPLIEAFSFQPHYRRTINALHKMLQAHSAKASAHASRLIWHVRFAEDGSLINLVPRLQKRLKTGLWSAGKKVSLESLLKKPQRLSEQDQRICAAAHLTSMPSKSEEMSILIEQSLPAFIDHPYLYSATYPHQKVQIRAGRPEIRINDNGKGILLEVIPYPDRKHTICRRTGPSRWEVIGVTPVYRELAEHLGQHGLIIPSKERTKLEPLIQLMAEHADVFSDIALPENDIEQMETDSRIYLQLAPEGEGFHVSMRVRPLGTKGPALEPGAGKPHIMANFDGRQHAAIRDLNLEQKNAMEVETTCSVLSRHHEVNKEWLLPNAEECLNLLLSLRRLLDRNVILEWPKGERLRIKNELSTERLSVSLRRKESFFELDGQVQIDEQKVLSMQKLLQRVRQSNSRFVPLGEGEFLALTRDVYDHIQQLNGLLKQEKSHCFLHPASLAPMHDFFQKIHALQCDSAAEASLQRLTDALQATHPLPSGLKTELRDYQLAGYQWMMRLASLGFGACLADDMGLGKTIQALAALLSLSSKGPCLVVAPTSVCQNWQQEAEKFAPSLRVAVFGADNRADQIKQLRRHDLLITSYGLLQQEIDLFTTRTWQVIVLDEAQAIKNMGTKRSKAAMTLKGEFKLITTGTPIENNLAELWNLFQFINPGLLGTHQQFNRRFAGPIEKERRKDARLRLRQILSPFILRRLKSEVLQELPPRTDILFNVELTDDEKSFYEALRRQSVAAINEHEIASRGGQTRILAEIMKLRRACCNPQLIAPDSSIQSSKLKIFGRIIDDLLANGHRVLVFSQFVDHLALIRTFLDEKHHAYLYLDGSTPAKARKDRIAAFQNGECDIFLISLKAGGLGINLTKANYVIHMDPWWNPAVEDQASDRAHRIGQQQPVTIYRLITSATIEEKIVKLHAHKRELADQLLQGSDMSGKISTKELFDLIKEAPMRQG